MSTAPITVWLVAMDVHGDDATPNEACVPEAVYPDRATAEKAAALAGSQDHVVVPLVLSTEMPRPVQMRTINEHQPQNHQRHTYTTWVFPGEPEPTVRTNSYGNQAYLCGPVVATEQAYDDLLTQREVQASSSKRTKARAERERLARRLAALDARLGDDD